MNEIDKTSLSDQTKFRLNEFSKMESYFDSEVNMLLFLITKAKC